MQETDHSHETIGREASVQPRQVISAMTTIIYRDIPSQQLESTFQRVNPVRRRDVVLSETTPILTASAVLDS